MEFWCSMVWVQVHDRKGYPFLLISSRRPVNRPPRRPHIIGGVEYEQSHSTWYRDTVEGIQRVAAAGICGMYSKIRTLEDP